MTVHVLHAGDGYTYLTRQVASGDHQRRRGEALADYYTAAGNPPGRWVGTGLAVMAVDGQVSEAQMKALFGEGLHPDADVRVQEALSRGVDREAAVAAVRLGPAIPDDRPVPAGMARPAPWGVRRVRDRPRSQTRARSRA